MTLEWINAGPNGEDYRKEAVKNMAAGVGASRREGRLAFVGAAAVLAGGIFTLHHYQVSPGLMISVPIMKMAGTETSIPGNNITLQKNAPPKEAIRPTPIPPHSPRMASHSPEAIQYAFVCRIKGEVGAKAIKVAIKHGGTGRAKSSACR